MMKSTYCKESIQLLEEIQMMKARLQSRAEVQIIKYYAQIVHIENEIIFSNLISRIYFVLSFTATFRDSWYRLAEIILGFQKKWCVHKSRERENSN